jgi:cation diffusion facilitator CzcD-associated flavoprotein CzcO
VNATDPSIVIVGSGFSGLCMAIRLKEAGHDDFVVLEKARGLGGTWRENTYPGCACDVQSHLYSYSFEPNPRWSRMFSPQPEIRAYLEHCATKYGVAGHIRYGAEVTGAEYDDAARTWRVDIRDAAPLTCRAVMFGMGPLHVPKIPEIPGVERFAGPAFHSAEWDHSVDLRGKRVAVVGTGASAIQFVPAIAPEVESLDLFQRTPPWIMPKPDREISEREHDLFARFPAAQRARRNAIYWINESRIPGFDNPRLMRLAQRVPIRHIHKQIKDPELRAKVTPDHTMGCKRTLLSDDYYPALTRDNVAVITDGIQEITENAVVTSDGVAHEADVIIFGTGFHVTDALDALRLTGRGGRKLSEAWSDGMSAYLGTAVSGFPNMFLLIGPNTGLGHSSMIFMIEAQVHYIIDCLRLLSRTKATAIDVRPRVMDAFNAGIQRKLSGTVWASGCTSWYLDANGKNTTVWPGFTWKFFLQTRRVRAGDYELIR